MWNNTDPKKIFALSKKINKMTLSEDAKNITGQTIQCDGGQVMS